MLGLHQGFLQGGTFNHADEIQAANVAGASSGDDYQKARDYLRMEDRGIQNNSPTAYGVGEILGNTVGFGLAGKAAGALAGALPSVAKVGAGVAGKAGELISAIPKVGPALSRAGSAISGAVKSIPTPAMPEFVSKAADFVKTSAPVAGKMAESALLMGADEEGRQEAFDPERIYSSAAIGAAVPAVMSSAKWAAQNPAVEKAAESASKFVGKGLQLPADAIDWVLGKVGAAGQYMGGVLPSGVVNVSADSVIPHSATNTIKLKEQFIKNSMNQMSGAYAAALDHVKDFSPETTSLAAAWGNKDAREAVVKAAQAAFSERSRDAYKPSPETIKEYIEEAISATGGNQNLAKFLRGTVKLNLSTHLKSTRNKMKLLGAERLMEDEQMARTVHETSDTLRRIELGLLDENGFNYKNLSEKELAEGTRLGQYGGYGSVPHFFTLDKRTAVPGKISIPLTTEQITEMEKLAESQGKTLRNIATGQRMALGSAGLSGAGLGAAALMGKGMVTMSGLGGIAAMGAPYVAAAAGRALENNPKYLLEKTQKLLLNPSILAALAKTPGRVGKAAQWALDGMAASGATGLKSRVLVMSQMPGILDSLKDFITERPEETEEP